VIDCVTGNKWPGTGPACALPPRQLSRHVNAVDLGRAGTIDALGEPARGRARMRPHGCRHSPATPSTPFDLRRCIRIHRTMQPDQQLSLYRRWPSECRIGKCLCGTVRDPSDLEQDRCGRRQTRITGMPARHSIYAFGNPSAAGSPISPLHLHSGRSTSVSAPLPGAGAPNPGPSATTRTKIVRARAGQSVRYPVRGHRGADTRTGRRRQPWRGSMPARR
jgi:hypothetical protein